MSGLGQAEETDGVTINKTHPVASHSSWKYQLRAPRSGLV